MEGHSAGVENDPAHHLCGALHAAGPMEGQRPADQRRFAQTRALPGLCRVSRRFPGLLPRGPGRGHRRPEPAERARYRCPLGFLHLDGRGTARLPQDPGPDGPRPRAEDPIHALGRHGWTGAWEHLLPTLQDPVARALLDIMASHSYGAPDDKARRQFAAASARNGLPVWMSEMSLMFPPAPDDPGMNAAIQMARYMHRDLVEAHASAWIYCFAIFTSKFQGSMGVLSPADGQGPLHGHWCSQTFLGDGELQPLRAAGMEAHAGHRRQFCQHRVHSPGADRFVIVAVNPEATSHSVVYECDRRTIAAVEAFATTVQSGFDPRFSSPVVQPYRFSATLPPMSVTTFSGKFGIVEDQNDPRADLVSPSDISLNLGPPRQLLHARTIGYEFRARSAHGSDTTTRPFLPAFRFGIHRWPDPAKTRPVSLPRGIF